MSKNRLLTKLLTSSTELRWEELEDFLWENSKRQYNFDNYTLYHMEDQINVLYDIKKGEIVEVTG